MVQEQGARLLPAMTPKIGAPDRQPATVAPHSIMAPLHPRDSLAHDLMRHRIGLRAPLPPEFATHPAAFHPDRRGGGSPGRHNHPLGDRRGLRRLSGYSASASHVWQVSRPSCAIYPLRRHLAVARRSVALRGVEEPRARAELTLLGVRRPCCLAPLEPCASANGTTRQDAARWH